MATNNSLSNIGVLQVDSINSQFDEVNIVLTTTGLAQRVAPTGYQVAGYFDEVTVTGVSRRLTKTGVLQVAGYFDEVNFNKSSGGGGGGGGGTYATGGTVTTVGGYRIHTFTASDTFATTASWPSGLTIQYWVGAGGGGGAGSGNGPGGGGAGGLLTASGVSISPSASYAITVGSGGSGGATGASGSNGVNSSIGGAINVTAIGGGGGGADGVAGNSGGSGGGGGNSGAKGGAAAGGGGQHWDGD